MYGFMVNGLKGLKTYNNNGIVMYPDRSFKGARVGIYKLNKITKVIKDGQVLFFDGEMIETDEITKEDLKSTLINSLNIGIYSNVYVEEGVNGFILIEYEGYIENRSCKRFKLFFKKSGVLIGFDVPLALGRSLFAIYNFKEYYKLSGDFILTEDKFKEACLRLLGNRATFSKSNISKFIMYEHRYITVDNEDSFYVYSFYVYNKYSGIAENIYYRGDKNLEIDYTDKVELDIEEIYSYMCDNKIKLWDLFLYSTPDDDSIVTEFDVKTKDSTKFADIKAFSTRTFRTDFLDDESLVSEVEDSFKDYFSYVDSVKHNFNSSNIANYKDCLTVKGVLGLNNV